MWFEQKSCEMAEFLCQVLHNIERMLWKRMKRPLERGLRTIGHRLCLDLPNFVRRRGVETVVFRLFLCQVLDNIENMLWKKNERATRRWFTAYRLFDLPNFVRRGSRLSAILPGAEFLRKSYQIVLTWIVFPGVCISANCFFAEQPR